MSLSGNYSISKSYIALLGQLPRVKQEKLIWNSIILPKHKMILRMAYQNRILNKERMSRLNTLVNDLTCCFCEENEIENDNHFLLDVAGYLK